MRRGNVFFAVLEAVWIWKARSFMSGMRRPSTMSFSAMELALLYSSAFVRMLESVLKPLMKRTTVVS